MRQRDGDGLIEYAAEETHIRKSQGFCFDGVQCLILNLTDDMIENDILKSFRSVQSKLWWAKIDKLWKEKGDVDSK